MLDMQHRREFDSVTRCVLRCAQVCALPYLTIDVYGPESVPENVVLSDVYGLESFTDTM